MNRKAVHAVVNRAKALLAHVDDQILFIDMTDRRIQQRYIDPVDLRAAVNNIPADSGWMPPEVIRWGQTGGHSWFTMFFPPTVRDLFIESNGNSIAQLRLPMPGIVYTSRGHRVWAVKTDTFSPSAPTYRVPLPNIYPDGRICIGPSNKAPDPSNPIVCWRQFLETPFNRHLSNGLSKTHPDNIIPKLLQLHEQHARNYPLPDLICRNQTVNEAFSGGER